MNTKVKHQIIPVGFMGRGQLDADGLWLPRGAIGKLRKHFGRGEAADALISDLRGLARLAEDLYAEYRETYAVLNVAFHLADLLYRHDHPIVQEPLSPTDLSTALSVVLAAVEGPPHIRRHHDDEELRAICHLVQSFWALEYPDEMSSANAMLLEVEQRRCKIQEETSHEK